jgi:hypothetical protein
MSMSPGTRTVGSGTMARAIYDEIEAELDDFDPDPDDPGVLWARLAAAIANGVIAHMTANAAVRVSITTSDGALQQYNNGLDDVDTTAPSTDRTLDGVIE